MELVEAGKGHLLLQQYSHSACFYQMFLTSYLYDYHNVKHCTLPRSLVKRCSC